ncbi:restriction endonuclease subunit S [Staphylococcus cohnii]|uniref:restriction endonuclease subunit S n=1 Tax=Staphylococcus cohnii TaxID=29382 RepID=UPI0005891A95|nr:restriction endonuclease subunit S [Staphylococcus cohnii]
MKPILRFSEFENDWEKDKLNNLGDFTSGGTPLKSNLDYWNGDIPWITTGDIANLRKENINNFITEKALEESSAKLIENRAILIAMYGQGRTRGMSAILNFNAATNQACAIFQTDFDINFVYYFFQKSYKYIRSLSNDGSQKNLSLNLLKEIQLNYPSKMEQNKIGEFFSKLDCQIELEEQKLAKLEEQKKGYMQQIFSQQLRFKDENGNEYPEWEEKKLGDILERGNKDKVNEIGKYRRLTISLHGKGLYEVKQERKTKDTRPFYQRFEGELIIGKQNFFNGSIAIVTREFNGFICSNAIMSYKISNHMNRTYLLEYLLQNDFLRKNEYLADGTGQKELSEKKFEELEIKLPNSINEQQKIGVFLERLDNLIEKQSNKLELLKQRKKSFLQKMFV